MKDNKHPINVTFRAQRNVELAKIEALNNGILDMIKALVEGMEFA